MSRMTGIPQVSGRELRPRRFWYVVAGVIALGGILLGIGLFILGLVTAVRSVPDLGTQFTAGEAKTVTMTAGDKKVIFADSAAVNPTCTGSAPNGGNIDLSTLSYSFTVTKGDREWRGIYEDKTDKDGAYQITCGAPSDSSPATEYAIGDAPKFGGFLGGILGGLAALFGLPCFGIVVAAVIALVTALRRNSYKRRLLQERGALPGYPPPSGT
jgi:hypothetical protein